MARQQQKKLKAEVLAMIRKDLLSLMDQWKETKGMLLKAFLDNKEISDAEEAKFLEMKTSLARNSKKLETQLAKVNMVVGASEIEKILKAAVNLRTLSKLNTITKKNLYGTWHVGFLTMHRTLGSLDFFNEGYRPPKKGKKVTASDKLGKKVKGVLGSKATGDEGDSESSIKQIAIIIGGVAAAGLLIFVAMNYF